jgi:hypothetical protein
VSPAGIFREELAMVSHASPEPGETILLVDDTEHFQEIIGAWAHRARRPGGRRRAEIRVIFMSVSRGQR